MSRRLALAWALLTLASSSLLAQVPYSGNLIPSKTSLARVGLERHWYTTVPLLGVERLLEVSMADNLLFAQTNLGNFYTYDAESGQLLWSAILGGRSAAAMPASVNSNRVFVTHANYLHALERHSGRPVWKQDLGILPTSATAADEERVMVGLTNGKLVAFNISNRFPVWNWQTSGPLTSRPISAGRVVAFGSGDGKVYVALSESPTLIYRFATGGAIFAPLGGFGTRTLLVPSSDNTLYAIDLFTADLNWSFASGAPIRQEPLVAGNDVLIVNTAGTLSVLDALSGQPRWTTSTYGGQLISVSEKRIYLESHDGDMFIVDRATGKILADAHATLQRSGLNLRDYTLGLSNNLNDRLYMATPSGVVVCFREIGQVAPRPLRDSKAPPLGFIPPEGYKTTPPVAPPAESTATPKEEKETPEAKEKETPEPKEKEAPEAKEKEAPEAKEKEAPEAKEAIPK